ncbi:MAG TPA: porin family protein [Epsilonproteobacteria bacterium]|nr:porin family protein [Campylobacterota bacterium]
MKNIVLSAAAVFAMSSFAVAGGDIAPIQEPVVEVPEVVAPVTDAGFYLGLGYGVLSGDETYTYGGPLGGEVTVEQESRDFDQLLLMAGYQFNSYVTVEGRYWLGMNDLTDNFWYEGELVMTKNELDAWGIYVKPQYPVTPEFTVYALLGYATTTLDQTAQVNSAIGNPKFSTSTDLDGFSWGLGASYTFNESVSIFVDYVSLYDDTYDEYDYDALASSDFTIDTINVGVSYRF